MNCPTLSVRRENPTTILDRSEEKFQKIERRLALASARYEAALEKEKSGKPSCGLASGLS
ncbi:MAG: hypothetical protein LBJ61_11840 [Deltaproteobacteria bacterium]|jgi:hypothetical protein|nr:hypothetical protein [Deltaproteobacteria bacterium]